MSPNTCDRAVRHIGSRRRQRGCLIQSFHISSGTGQSEAVDISEDSVSGGLALLDVVNNTGVI